MLRGLVIFAVFLAGCVTGGGVSEATPADAAAATDASDASVSEASIFPVEDAWADYGVEEVAVPEVATGATTIVLTIDGTECKSITCPAEFPYVVGCDLSFGGSSSQVCIVHQGDSSTVLFKEGQSCGSASVRGTVTCGTTPGAALDAGNCKVNKSKPLYIPSLAFCPG